MLKNPHSDIFTIGIGGAAGDGVLEVGSNLGLLLTHLGYEVYLSSNYPSLIRGGHNFVRLSFSKNKIWNDYSGLDFMISLNEESTKLHVEELNEKTIMLADSFEKDFTQTFGGNAVFIPMMYSIRKIEAPAVTRSSVALGSICCLLGLSLEVMEKMMNVVFKDKKLELNVKLAKIGYDHIKEKNISYDRKIEPKESSNLFLDGNTAFSRGLQMAGLDFYVAYPMTPASSILHYLASKQVHGGLKVVQPENEISVINMALGMAYAGKRVAVGSATGGFSLMQESFSFAGIAELPVVIAISQRQAPATGVPTRSSQSDLRFVVHAGHGEFPRIVLVPGDSEESFSLGWQALNLAWKFQVPVIVLLDKILSEHMMTCSLDEKSIHIDRGRVIENTDESYGRYEIVEDGISPMAFPGAKNTVVKVTSYEHDEKGITTDKTEDIKKMLDKRFTKIRGIEEDMKGRETVKLYGDLNSENVIVFLGSTKSAVLEASKYFDKKVKLVQIIWLEPFNSEEVKRELKGKNKIICIEANHDGQLASIVREKTGIEINEKILKYDSLPFEPLKLAEQINNIFNN